MYIIKKGKKPLSTWFPNANCLGSLSETISFSNRHYMVFPTYEEALDRIWKMEINFWNMPVFEDKQQEKNFNKMHNIFKKLKIEVEE